MPTSAALLGKTDEILSVARNNRVIVSRVGLLGASR